MNFQSMSWEEGVRIFEAFEYLTKFCIGALKVSAVVAVFADGVPSSQDKIRESNKECVGAELSDRLQMNCFSLGAYEYSEVCSNEGARIRETISNIEGASEINTNVYIRP